MVKLYKSTQLVLIISLCLITSPVYAEDFVCKVSSVESGDHFTCSNKKKVKIWGIETPKVQDSKTEGNKAKDYLKNFIQDKELYCTVKGKQSDSVVAQCILDLKVKSIDVADPLIIGNYVKELKKESKGYYSNPDRPRSE